MPALLAAQAHTAALAGTVRDTLGHPLRQVIVTVDSTTLTAISDDSGRFHVKGIPPGRNGFALKRIGFAPIDFETTLDSGRTLVVDIRMTSLVTLSPVMVTADREARLAQTGFTERQKIGLGSFIRPEKFDSLSNLPSATMMVQAALAGRVRRSCPARGNSCDLVFPRFCRWLFVDGKQVEGTFDENVAPGEIHAIEIYDRIAIVPGEFQGRLPMSRQSKMLSPTAGCGAIAVWTKGRVAP